MSCRCVAAVVLLAGLCPVVAAGGDERGECVDKYLTEMMTKEKIPGLSVIVARDGKVVKGDSRVLVMGRAANYEAEGNGLRPRWLTYPQCLRAAAGINTNADDLLLWVQALADGKLLKPSSLDVMWEGVKLRDGKTFHFEGLTNGYACGFVTDDRLGHRSVGHDGGSAVGFRYFRDDRVIVILLTNGKADPDEMICAISRFYIPGSDKRMP
jgi:CubicO group peptidase (beta-lactamase class C family)